MSDPQPPCNTRIETSVVIPVYYNESSLADVVHSVRREWVQSGRDAAALEFVLVDDGSADRSWDAILRLQAEDPGSIAALRLAKNHGSQLAILAGAAATRGEKIAMIAADGQEPPDLVARMAHAAEQGNRMVLAVRRSRADSPGTRGGAGFFYSLIRLLGLTHMPAEGFDAFLMDRAVMDLILGMRDPNIPLSVTIAWLGYPYAEVAYDRAARAHGKSRWTFTKKLKLALDAITAVSYAPIRLISLFGVVVAFAGFIYAAIAITLALRGGIPVQGWTSLLVTILVLGGTQLVALGVIGEYLWRTLEVARTRPLWRIAETRPFRSNTDAGR